MTTPRWKKVFADLWGNKARSILVALSIAVGVFAVGLVVSSFFVVKQDMEADYFAINPHTCMVFAQDFDDDLLAELKTIPGVDAIEGRYNLWINAAAASGKRYPINIHSIAPLADIRVDQLVFQEGSLELQDGQIYLERQGAEGLGLKTGQSVDLVLKTGQTVTLKIAGTLHDVNANPFKFTSQTSGYVTRKTMESLGGSSLYNFVALVTSGSHTDAAHIRTIADLVADRISQSGREVTGINIIRPGQHPSQATIDTALMFMGLLGIMSVFLSAFLVTNTISALMGQQIRQIGMMKAIGASTGQMLAMYLVLVLAFGALALAIAVPLSALAAFGFTRWLIGMLNANASPFFIPPVSLVLQIVIGLAVPLLGALAPVIAGARMTVRQAISSYGLSSSVQNGLVDRIVGSLRGLPRPLLLSLRNTIRRKGRLALTLVTLTLGGAIFIGVLGVRESIYKEIDQTYGYLQSDVNADLAAIYPLDRLNKAAQAVPGIVATEGWWTGRVSVQHADGLSSDQAVFYAPPANTRLISPVLTEGRWLLPSDENGVVVDNHFMDIRPDVKVGDSIQVHMAKQDYTFQVVGIFRMAGGSTIATLYANNEVVARMLNVSSLVNSLRVVTDRHDAARQNQVLEALQTNLKNQDIDATLVIGSDIISNTRSQVNMLITLLLFMAVLIAAVGGLGLTGSMGMNVLERTREMGVMRSIGAENGKIFQLVVVEGILIGLVSWALSILAAIPITQLLDNQLGERLMTVPLVYSLSTNGIVIWLALLVIIATIASLLPARSAVRLTVRDVLAYE
jgi:putative ABC transport system permease protein